MNLRRGLWRVALVVWALGALVGLMFASSGLGQPRMLVAPDGWAGYSCVAKKKSASQPGPSSDLRTQAAKVGDTRVLDGVEFIAGEDAHWHLACVPLYRTSKYWDDIVEPFLAGEALWAALVWGGFYVGNWVGKGFRL